MCSDKVDNVVSLDFIRYIILSGLSHKLELWLPTDFRYSVLSFKMNC